jgi:hypothetical protein
MSSQQQVIHPSHMAFLEHSLRPPLLPGSQCIHTIIGLHIVLPTIFVIFFVVIAMRLVEETEAHVLVGLLLLLLLGSLWSSLGGSGTWSGTTGSWGSSAARWDGGKLGGALGDQLNQC